MFRRRRTCHRIVRPVRLNHNDQCYNNSSAQMMRLNTYWSNVQVNNVALIKIIFYDMENVKMYHKFFSWKHLYVPIFQNLLLFYFSLVLNAAFQYTYVTISHYKIYVIQDFAFHVFQESLNLRYVLWIFVKDVKVLSENGLASESSTKFRTIQKRFCQYPFQTPIQPIDKKTCTSEILCIV